jgi:hypothetical protein
VGERVLAGPEDLPGCDLQLPLLSIDRVGARLARSSFSIDRLCLNQADKTELNQQVLRMGEINHLAYTGNMPLRNFRSLIIR